MVDLMEAVRGQSPEIDAALIDRHFRSLSPGYFERYSAADIARHLRLLAALGPERTVEVEVRPLTTQAFEIVVVGYDYPGTLACITAALTAYGFNVEDVQVATYPPAETEEEAEHLCFVIVLRASGNLRGRPVAEFGGELRDRLQTAFGHLAEGNLLDAQTVVADTRQYQAETARFTPRPRGFAQARVDRSGVALGGDFRLQRKLATGGTSEVYLGRQLSLDRTVAVKLFLHTGQQDDELFARFNREAVVLAQLSCAHIVQILAAGSLHERTGGLLGWMAMEYLAGGDLGNWVRRNGPPPVELAATWLRQALEGLYYAHRRGILHRDLKPHNLLLTGEGLVKISDFGLLKAVARPSPGLTPRSAIVGTPYYMSPEQALGEPVDERSDIFSLGATFFHVITGRLPFDKGSATAVLVQIAQHEAPRLRDAAPGIPVPLDIILNRMLARRREERYQDVGVVLEELTSYETRSLLKFATGDTVVPLAPPPVWTEPQEKTEWYLARPEA